MMAIEDGLRVSVNQSQSPGSVLVLCLYGVALFRFECHSVRNILF